MASVTGTYRPTTSRDVVRSLLVRAQWNRDQSRLCRLLGNHADADSYDDQADVLIEQAKEAL